MCYLVSYEWLKMGFLDRLRGKPDVKSLRERGDVEGLIRSLSHKDLDVRCEAAKALGELRDRRAVPALIGALETVYVRQVRDAIEALVMIKDPDSVISLLRVLQDPHTVQAKRWNVANALGQMKDPRAVQPLSLMLKEEDSALVERAVKALGAIGGPDAVPALKSALEHREWGVHREAAEALEGIREATTDPSVKADISVALEGPDSIQALKSVLEREEWKVHREAAAVLEKIREMSTDPSIRADISAALERARKDRSEYRKLDVFEALKSVEGYRVTAFPKAKVRWPNCCSVCLGPVEVTAAASGTDYVTAGRGKYRVVRVDGVPYCKFCRDKGPLGVNIEIWGSSVTLVFKNPEYGKMFAQANLLF